MKLSIKPRRLAMLLAAAAATLGVSAGSAMAARGNSITTVMSGSLALTPPFFGTATGSYTTTGVVDFGTVTAQFVLPIQPPKATQIETFRTLTSTEGNGTLQLPRRSPDQGYKTTRTRLRDPARCKAQAAFTQASPGRHG